MFHITQQEFHNVISIANLHFLPLTHWKLSLVALNNQAGSLTASLYVCDIQYFLSPDLYRQVFFYKLVTYGYSTALNGTRERQRRSRIYR